MYLRISVTDRCNLKCIYCFPDNYRKLPRRELLTFEEIATAVKVFRKFGLNKVRITGGEPLLRRGVCSLAEKITRLGIPTFLSTNGVFLSRFAEDLKRAGVKRVNVSVDSLKPEKYTKITGADRLNMVLSGIEKAMQCGLEVKINVVVMKGLNEQEITDFMEFFLPRGIQVRFIELMPFSYTRDRFHRFFIPYTEIIKNIKGRYALKPTGTDGVAKIFEVPELKGKIGFITPVSQPFCSGCNRFRITASGKLKVCLHSKHEVDIKEILRKENAEEKLSNLLTELLLLKKNIHKPSWESKSQMVNIGG